MGNQEILSVMNLKRLTTILRIIRVSQKHSERRLRTDKAFRFHTLPIWLCISLILFAVAAKANFAVERGLEADAWETNTKNLTWLFKSC